MDSEFNDRIGLLRLRRIEQLNERLKQQLKKERIPASKAAALIVEHTEETKDPLVPYLWSESADQNKFRSHQNMKSGRQSSGGSCCTIV
ncbi:hypothetical protein FT663_03293 [Candidozyma haemuli var. vulneris]|nr:hypothetical protein FT662_03390 [[Candida] haemuloni var. vulneris]KAF3990144.1 hypothetical protein FT663_03293 [[Candida] haemuloni var. vulneris]